MMIGLIALIALATTTMVMASGNAHGIVELDEVSFGKVVGRQQHVLLTLNEFSWKSPENYNDVADAFKDNADVLVAKLDASQLADGHALKVKTHPTLRFYPANSKEHVEFVGSADTASDVIEFVQFQLSPKLKELKSLAQSLLQASNDARSKIVNKAEALVATLDAQFAKTGKLYVATMKRVAEKGGEFVTAEKKRLAGLVESKSVVADKAKEFKQRLAVLEAFGTQL